MATSSFDRPFVVEDPESIKKLIEIMNDPAKRILSKGNIEEELKRGRALLEKSLLISLKQSKS